MTRQQRADMARLITDAQREVYEAEGEEGDFDDAHRYYRDDASEAELLEDHAKWCKA